jgi:Tol biopolymer transport system component
LIAADGRSLSTIFLDTDGRIRQAQSGSPDGTELATSNAGDVWVISVDGPSERNLTELPQEAIAPRWSPYGTRLLYAASDGTRVVPLEGGDPLGFGPAARAGHLWSPDGAQVAFGRQQVDGATVLAIVDADSGVVRATVPTPDLSYPAGVHYASWQRLAIGPSDSS